MSHETDHVLRAERRGVLDAMKLESGCVDCGYAEHPAALQFDHRDRATKAFTISEGLLRSWAAITAEIAKCDVRCANCHAIRTSADGYGSGRPRTQPATCSVERCDDACKARGLCKRHYDRDRYRRATTEP